MGKRSPQKDATWVQTSNSSIDNICKRWLIFALGIEWGILQQYRVKTFDIVIQNSYENSICFVYLFVI